VLKGHQEPRVVLLIYEEASEKHGGNDNDRQKDIDDLFVSNAGA